METATEEELKNRICHLETRVAQLIDKNVLLGEVRKWKHGWMRQSDYFQRAFNIDANMLHSLATLLSGREAPPEDSILELLKIIEEYERALDYIADSTKLGTDTALKRSFADLQQVAAEALLRGRT